ncbi:MAG: phage gp6-like head-tail connector protein [Lachnospiraceae bacterium]|nr:phage gp6-like head-tail connector protein [Lachnospiraceae bacterium]
MLEKVKVALRITTDDFDTELTDLINACLLDLGIAGVVVPYTPTTDSYVLDNELVIRAIITYCKVHFGDVNGVEMLEQLKKSYDEQKAQMQMATGYTSWNAAT